MRDIILPQQKKNLNHIVLEVEKIIYIQTIPKIQSTTIYLISSLRVYIKF